MDSVLLNVMKLTFKGDPPRPTIQQLVVGLANNLARVFKTCKQICKILNTSGIW